jgi:hypothetical protein
MRGARPNRVTEREDDASELIAICQLWQEFGKSSGGCLFLIYAVAKYHNNSRRLVDVSTPTLESRHGRCP